MLTIGLAVSIRGDIRSTEPVTVLGIVEGLIDSPEIYIDPRATVTGVLLGQKVVVGGHVIGDVFADLLRLSETATVHGNILHAALDLSVGAYFEGQSRRHPLPLTMYRKST